MKTLGVFLVLIGICMMAAEPINPSLSLSLAGGIAGLATVAVGALLYRYYDRTI
jgi:drug/metabolite transporter (DMT)-like permease